MRYSTSQPDSGTASSFAANSKAQSSQHLSLNPKSQTLPPKPLTQKPSLSLALSRAQGVLSDAMLVL